MAALTPFSLAAQRHGAAWFLLIAWGALLAQAAGIALPPEAELAVLALLVVFGLPHGALDLLLLRRCGRPVAATRLYTGVALLVIAAWNVAPATTLAAFLAISWLHFGVSDRLPTTPGAAIPAGAWLEGLVRGGAPLVLIAAAHPQRMTELFGLLVPAEQGALLARLLGHGVIPWSAAALWLLLSWIGARQWKGALELCTLALLFWWAPPLLAFAIYFAFLHSLRSLGALLQGAGASAPRRQWLAAALIPTLFTLAAALFALLWMHTEGLPQGQGLLRVIFIGLAALTFPHVLLWAWGRAAGNRRQGRFR
jgi:beta-carotene 15,15'-dioxygenase